jgi:glutathione S-transferase
MKLHGVLASPYVGRVVLFSRLKGIDLVPVMPEGGIKTEAFLAMNPIGKIPVLEVDGTYVPESEVICEYLDDTHPGKGLVPTDALGRAAARLVSRIQDLYVMPHAVALFLSLNPAQRDATAVETARQGLATAYAHLEHFMTANPYAAGSKPSLADCALIPAFEIMQRTVFPAFGIADPRKGSGKIARWWKAVSAAPVIEPFLAEYGPAVEAFMKARAG